MQIVTVDFTLQRMNLSGYIVAGILILIIGYAIAATFAIIYSLVYQQLIPDRIRGLRILIITAHPDDECMFFTPTITSLRRQNLVQILCLSTGP